MALLIALLPSALAFDPGSTGADGALDLTGQSGEVLFDPGVLGIDPERDNVFHFTSVTIPAGVTLRMYDDLTRGPVHFLVQGDVTIGGAIDLSGEDGGPAPVTATSTRPGPGGMPGGLQSSVSQLQYAPAAGCSQCSAGSFMGRHLYPLIGGAGADGQTSHRGSAGGGAVLIAFGGALTLDGVIDASGGQAPSFSADAGGGAVRIVGPSVAGTGTIVTIGDRGSTRCRQPDGSVNYDFSNNPRSGPVRIETLEMSLLYSNISTNGWVCDFTPSGDVNINTGPFIVPLVDSTPLLPPDLQAGEPVPVIRLASVDGEPVLQPTSGDWTLPDAVIDNAGASTIVIETERVPLGTALETTVGCPDGFTATGTTPGVSGTFALGTTSIDLEVPSGLCQIAVRGDW